MGYSYGPSIVKDGMVMCLDAGNRKSYAGSGNTWYDISGYGNNATKNGNAANPVWNSNGYFTFGASDGTTGVNNIFTVNTSTSLNSLSAITVQFVCAMELKTLVGSDSAWMAIVSRGAEGSQHPATSINQLSGQRYYHIETPSQTNSGFNLFQNSDYTGTKFNVFQTRSSSAGTFGFLNGVQVANSANTLSVSSPTIYIGSNGSFELFKGKFACLYIYNRALTNTELLQNYNALKGRFGL
jgi:hypothetical protein